MIILLYDPGYMSTTVFNDRKVIVKLFPLPLLILVFQGINSRIHNINIELFL